PEPNSQLQLVWLLDHLRPHASVISRLSLAQTSKSIGNHRPEEWIVQRPRAVPIHTDHLEIASIAWAGWRAPTPDAWFDLLAQDLSVIPRLRSTVEALLEELPRPTTGLGMTEM